MRPTITLQPTHNSSADMLRCFASGTPLSPEQLNFLEWHEHELSNQLLDPVIRYYLESLKKRKRDYRTSFLLPHEIINRESIQQLKKRIDIFLKEKKRHAVIQLTKKEYELFKYYIQQELVIWHGNPTKAPIPFFPQGIPAVLYFKWGHVFCAVKYVAVPDGNMLRSNILVYFEDMDNRDLNQCVYDYNLNFKNEIKLQKEIIQESLDQTKSAPELKLANYYLINHI
jgi:hypothetical protein